MDTEREGTCIYCGTFGIVDGDHVIPQCLWPSRVPKEAPVVDSCKPCNQIWKSGDDTYLRDLLVTNASSSSSPVARRIFPKFLRAMSNNQSQLAFDLRHAQLVELHPASPDMLLGVVTSPEADERTKRIPSTITRGLYNFFTRAIMPATVPITVNRLHDIAHVKDIMNLLDGFGTRYRIKDSSIFECMYGISPTDPYESAWLFNFYRRVQFIILTGSLTTFMVEEDKMPVDNQSVI